MWDTLPDPGSIRAVLGATPGQDTHKNQGRALIGELQRATLCPQSQRRSAAGGQRALSRRSSWRQTPSAGIRSSQAHEGEEEADAGSPGCPPAHTDRKLGGGSPPSR